jgi:hypothetical protein
MMESTGLAHLFKWENLHNWWLTKYFFLPHSKYMNILHSSVILESRMTVSSFCVGLSKMVILLHMLRRGASSNNQSQYSHLSHLLRLWPMRVGVQPPCSSLQPHMIRQLRAATMVLGARLAQASASDKTPIMALSSAHSSPVAWLAPWLHAGGRLSYAMGGSAAAISRHLPDRPR